MGEVGPGGDGTAGAMVRGGDGAALHNPPGLSVGMAGRRSGRRWVWRRGKGRVGAWGHRHLHVRCRRHATHQHHETF